MVYIKTWTDFETAASDLYAKSPNKVRYGVKFRPSTGLLVLKVTDDTTCLMYKSFSSIILNRFESLNLRLLSQIANTKPKARLLAGGLGSGEPSRAGTPGVGVVEDEPMTGTGTTGEVEAEKPPPKTEGKGGAGGGGGGGGGGGKKKKKGKR
ncbi:hypothetical protein EHS25_000107 [Saitozyma podzolica]|uniref:SRP9 domain-containing protein n=1 Tax=Saitozyma podzolica TaxID=1890683 RepID=A0A427YVB7_9TREE|nr:hypothetical protein EHS25_000107 [Saitozyma podzolica]